MTVEEKSMGENPRLCGSITGNGRYQSDSMHIERSHCIWRETRSKDVEPEKDEANMSTYLDTLNRLRLNTHRRGAILRTLDNTRLALRHWPHNRPE